MLARPLAAWPALALILGCANSPPLIAPALLGESSGTLTLNLLSNYGTSSYVDTVEVERSDGTPMHPTYENADMMVQGAIFTGDFAFLAVHLVNFQLQGYAGLRWRRIAALGYFPTLTLSGKHLLHGLQLDLNGFGWAFLSASLYEENFPSILTNPAFGEAGPVKTHAVGALFLNIPWRLKNVSIWVRPNYRRSLDRASLERYGLSLSLSVSGGKKAF